MNNTCRSARKFALIVQIILHIMATASWGMEDTGVGGRLQKGYFVMYLQKNMI